MMGFGSDAPAATAGELNAYVRSLGPSLTGADKRALAEELGVSVRTVQRWTTDAGQQRNPFSERLEGRPEQTWPAALQDRAAQVERLRAVLEDGYTSPRGQVEETEAARERFQSLPDAVLRMEEIGTSGDTWLDGLVLRATLTRTETGWTITYIYTRSYE